MAAHSAGSGFGTMMCEASNTFLGCIFDVEEGEEEDDEVSARTVCKACVSSTSAHPGSARGDSVVVVEWADPGFAAALTAEDSDGP